MWVEAHGVLGVMEVAVRRRASTRVVLAGLLVGALGVGFPPVADAAPGTAGAVPARAAVSAPAQGNEPSFGVCADVLFVVARGAGQPAAQDGGFGPQVDNVRARLTQKLAGRRTVEAVAVDFAAPALTTIFASRTGLKKYTQGIAKGVDRTRTLLVEKKSRRAPIRRSCWRGSPRVRW